MICDTAAAASSLSTRSNHRPGLQKHAVPARGRPLCKGLDGAAGLAPLALGVVLLLLRGSLSGVGLGLVLLWWRKGRVRRGKEEARREATADAAACSPAPGQHSRLIFFFSNGWCARGGGEGQASGHAAGTEAEKLHRRMHASGTSRWPPPRHHSFPAPPWRPQAAPPWLTRVGGLVRNLREGGA